ncbi:hypothetical protein M885DRAFT_543507 [Pelagophyceae sp. CCMP2097]|nr:hypothetical protein M885DRAFT_543507 [Pelagophyceae sp. CCMP2097]
MRWWSRARSARSARNGAVRSAAGAGWKKPPAEPPPSTRDQSWPAASSPHDAASTRLQSQPSAAKSVRSAATARPCWHGCPATASPGMGTPDSVCSGVTTTAAPHATDAWKTSAAVSSARRSGVTTTAS